MMISGFKQQFLAIFVHIITKSGVVKL